MVRIRLDSFFTFLQQDLRDALQVWGVDRTGPWIFECFGIGSAFSKRHHTSYLRHDPDEGRWA